MKFGKLCTNSIAIKTSTLPTNMTADYVFAMLRLAPLLHFTKKASQQQLLEVRSLQTVLDLNNLSVEMLFRNVSLSLCSSTSLLSSHSIVSYTIRYIY